LVPIVLSQLIPNADDLLSLPVEELAGVLLVHLNSRLDDNRMDGVVSRGQVNYGAFFASLEEFGRQPEYGRRQPEVTQALMEAWSWLQGEGFLVRAFGQPAEWFFLSRRARRLRSLAEFEAYRNASLLPKGQLHPLIAAKVYPAFLRGDYDVAVFQAFREVEIAVREAGSFKPDDVGTELMRQALRPANREKPAVTPGPLTDSELPVAEQEGMAHLFAGAIALYKNPQSHRYVPTNAVDAADVIMFASQLLRIIDRLRQ
jgi:uncharacterized protein (TIGR02391 family)